MLNSNSSQSDRQYIHTDDPGHRIAETIVMSIIFIIGAVGNPVTAYTVVKNKKLHNLHNSLTMNIILVDSLATFTIVPTQIATLAYGRWPLNYAACQVYAFCIIVLSTCALWTILWLSILRILFISKPTKYAILVLPKYMVPIVASTWVVALSLGCMLFATDKLAFKPKFAVCFFFFTSVGEMSAFMIPFIIVPTVILSSLSIAIFRKLKKNRNSTSIQLQKHSEEKEIANNYLMLVFVYVTCYFPVYIIEAESVILQDVPLPHFVYMSVTFLGYLPFSVKTLAYMLTKKESRDRLRRFFRKTNKVTFHEEIGIDVQNDQGCPANKRTKIDSSQL